MDTTKHPGYRLYSVPTSPESLSEGARKEWEELMPTIYEMRTARPADLPALEMLCEIKADIRQLEKTIHEEGYTIEAGSGGRKAHPAMRTLTDARRQASTLLDRFGMYPTGMQAPRYEENMHQRRY